MPFNLLSFDYSEYYASSLAGTVTFTGNFVGGGSISKDVTSDGVFGFVSATFAEFNNLSSVVFSYPGEVTFQLDNISVTAVTEPSSLALLSIGAIGLFGYGYRRQGLAHIELLLSRDLRAFDSQKRVNEIPLLIVFEVVIVFRHEVEKNSGPFFPCFFAFHSKK